MGRGRAVKNALLGWLAAGVVAAAALVAGLAPGIRGPLATILPYLAVATFLVGMTVRVAGWASSPVPFRIPTTCGQQKSLPWIQAAPLENPSTGLGAMARVLLEAVLFRSLFRNSRARLLPDGRLVYGGDRLLWALGLAFHGSLLLILLRHLRFFLEPVPRFVLVLQDADGFFAVGIPTLYLSDFILGAALVGLLARRLADDKVRYLSLPVDHALLALLAGVAGTGLLLRHALRPDLAAIKELTIGLVTFHPVVPAGFGAVAFVHVALVSALLIAFPFSKLVHVAAPFLSPTRNLANDSRARRHVNPWNPDIHGRSYAEWEDEFRDRMKAAGLPVEKD